MTNFMTPTFSPWRKGARYPLNSRLGGPQSRAGGFGEKSVARAGIRSPVRSLVGLRCITKQTTDGIKMFWT